MAIQSTTLRPGLLVSLKTSIRGNVTYQTNVLDPDHANDAGALESRWETTRQIADAAEHERAKIARSKAAACVRRICAQSAFGLLCPEASGDALETAIAEARAIADDFNKSAALSRISVYVITGRIAADDVEAVKAINSEVRDLLGTMAEGVTKLDVQSIRDAANKARELGSMLPPETEARVRLAIDAARSAARRIVKAGETVAAEIDQGAVRRITEMRTSFLDLDSDGKVLVPVAAAGRAVDFDADAAPKGWNVAETSVELDIERN